jgi:hypothetical protein
MVKVQCRSAEQILRQVVEVRYVPQIHFAEHAGGRAELTVRVLLFRTFVCGSDGHSVGQQVKFGRIGILLLVERVLVGSSRSFIFRMLVRLSRLLLRISALCRFRLTNRGHIDLLEH